MTKLPKDFKPTEQSIKNLAKHGVLPDFIEYELDNFKTYFTETGAKKKSWQMTLQTWMRRAHQGKAGREWEENRHIRERYKTGLKTDLFSVLVESQSLLSDDSIIGSTSPGGVRETGQPNYRIQAAPIPGEGQTMTEAEGLAALKKYLK